MELTLDEDTRQLLNELTVDAHDDDEQLMGLEQGMIDALPSPVPVHVLGESMRLEEVSYNGSERRGIVGFVSRGDGQQHQISLLDVAVPPESDFFRFLAAYCLWCGETPREAP